jgi:hypothetical protein
MKKFLGGQLGVAVESSGMGIGKMIMYAIVAIIIIFILYKAFKPCPPTILKKEGFSAGCPCNNKKKSSSVWTPLM